MKKLLHFSILFSAFLFFSCGSTKVTFSDFSPMAILDVEGSTLVTALKDDFDYTDDDEPGALATAVNKLVDGKNPELLKAQDRAEYAEESLKKILEELNGMQFIDKEKVVNLNSYKFANMNLLGFMNTNTVAEGYISGQTSLSPKKARVLMSECGASSLISAVFTFNKKYQQKQVYPYVTMNVKILNSKGSVVLSKEYSAQGTASLPVFGGYNKYDKDAFVELFDEVIDTVITRFAMDFVE